MNEAYWLGPHVVECGCGWTAWSDIAQFGDWLQHGDNPEHRRFFPYSTLARSPLCMCGVPLIVEEWWARVLERAHPEIENPRRWMLKDNRQTPLLEIPGGDE